MTKTLTTSPKLISAQCDDVHIVPRGERDSLIVSAVRVDRVWVVKSHYGDEVWELGRFPSNVAVGERRIDFTRLPERYRVAMKEILYRYFRRGRNGRKAPAGGTVVRFFDHAIDFLRYLDHLKLKSLDAVSPLICANYVAKSRADRDPRRGTPVTSRLLFHRFSCVEALYELSQFTDAPMPRHPWADSSAAYLSGLSGSGRSSSGQTPLIPDDVFCTLFQEANALVGRASELLDMRDALEDVAARRAGQHPNTIKQAKARHLKAHGWSDGGEFNRALLDLRTACYIVVASLSGCRNHELGFVRSGACYRTEDDDGAVYWWMRSQSIKTGAGHTEWMIPDAAVAALRVMDRWALPHQAAIRAELESRRAVDALDAEIAEAQQHLRAVFLGCTPNQANRVRTLTRGGWSEQLKAFAVRSKLDWPLASHQFRRKFANYAARSQFGDLRYLREHFKHWSQDMTNDGYALNQSQEMELYAEIKEELENLKCGVAEQWLNPAEPLAGGYGKSLVAWRSREENIVLFKDRNSMIRSISESHAIRSNGHAWCTADDNKCIGNTFEKTRCSVCSNGVIGRHHVRLYQQLYDDLLQVATCEDIGLGGRARVNRDLERCRNVLVSLGYDPGAQAA